MTILYVEVGKRPEIRDVSNSLKTLQALVGGYIAVLRLHGNTVLVCNDDGIPLELPLNRYIAGVPIYGNFFIVNIEGKDFVSLPDSEIKKWTDIIELKGMI